MSHSLTFAQFHSSTTYTIPQFNNSTIPQFQNSTIPNVRIVCHLCNIFPRIRSPITNIATIFQYLTHEKWKKYETTTGFLNFSKNDTQENQSRWETTEVNNFGNTMLHTPYIPHTRRSLTSSHTKKSAVCWSTNYLTGKTSSHIYKTCTLWFVVSVLINFVMKILT